MIIGKSTLEQEHYDVLVFCIRNIENIKIPDFIEIIDSYSFQECHKLQSVEFPSNLKIIEKKCIC